VVGGSVATSLISALSGSGRGVTGCDGGGIEDEADDADDADAEDADETGDAEVAEEGVSAATTTNGADASNTAVSQ